MGCFCSKGQNIETNPAPSPVTLTAAPKPILRQPVSDQGKRLGRMYLANPMAPVAGTRRPRDPEKWQAVRTRLDLSSETQENAAYHRAVRRHFDMSSVSVKQSHTGAAHDVSFSSPKNLSPGSGGAASAPKKRVRFRSSVEGSRHA